MKRRLLKFGLCVLFLALCAARLDAQSENDTQLNNEEQTKTETACRQIPMREERTYLFRKLPVEMIPQGTYGPPKWYQKLFPFLYKQEKSVSVLEIENEIGRPIPFGETKRSQKIRSDSETKLIEVQKNAEQNWQNWLKQNPNATKEETEAAEIRIHF